MFPFRSKAIHLTIALLGAALFWVSGTSWANDDPPGRIGRVSDLAGELHLSNTATQSAWAEIGLNYPLTSSDDLWVGRAGRAEIDFGDGFLRLAEDTNVHLNRLDDRQIEVMLASGRMILSLRHLDAGEMVEVLTGNARISVLRPGSYRIDVNRDRSVTVLVVRDGEAALERTGESTVVGRGETATISGREYPTLDLRGGHYTDAFDAWSEARDRRFEDSASARYVSPQMIGWRDLDDHGRWHTHATYGALWYPRVVGAGWAPYRNGRWVWVSPWGWTWVDEAPWGFAPFHYGRWVHVSGRWAWAPGRYTVRPVYAPALVTFIGGASWSFSVRAPVFAWVPLGWREPYRPYYRSSDHYVHSVNRPYVVNHTEITTKPPAPANAFANIRVPGAVTSVPGSAFGSGRMVTENLVTVPRQALGGAPVLASAPAVKPIPLAPAAAGHGVVPASQMFRPNAAGSGIRELTGAPAGGVAHTPIQAAPRTSVAPPVLARPPREGKPVAGGSGVGEIGGASIRSNAPSARIEAPPAVRESRPTTAPREFSTGGGMAGAPTASRMREAPPAGRVERSAPPQNLGGGKPMMVPEVHTAPGNSGRALLPPRGAVEGRAQRSVAPGPGVPQKPPMVLEKPFAGKPEVRTERRPESRPAAQTEAPRVMEGPRLK
ncbi:MAG: FecR domain-containing protein [Betaproteobacteria bacterium]|nr:FecR domain-containing protein [Betaproteobacteria bacterium]